MRGALERLLFSPPSSIIWLAPSPRSFDQLHPHSPRPHSLPLVRSASPPQFIYPSICHASSAVFGTRRAVWGKRGSKFISILRECCV